MRAFSPEESIKGFKAVSVEELEDYKAKGVLLEHERTGFQVYYVQSEDKELFFSYTVYTPPENGKGLAHVIEHTVLSGSRKYPVKDPFMILVNNSPNTFLNALTGVDRTYYPAASTVPKDFTNLFQVYTDAVFSPLLREETFMQEGIRLSKSEDGLRFDGVVFNEMLGVMAEHGNVLSSASTKPLFGASPYQWESGGDAREICKLTYEEYLAAYRKWYVPANMSLFLYGDLDIEPLLGLLDEEYLSGREPGRRVERAPLAERWEKPRRNRAASAAEDGESGASVMVSWLLGDNSVPGNSTFLSLMVDLLLGSPVSPLYKAIAESGLGRDLSSESGMSSSYHELSFSAGFSGAEEADAERIEGFILDTLSAIARDGLDPMEIEAAIRRMEFSLKEIPGGIPMGMRLFFSAEKAMTFGGNPSDMLRPSRTIKAIRAAWEKDPRYFENWIKENLIDNPHRLLTVVSSEEEAAEEIGSSIARVLEERKGSYSEEKEERFRRFQLTPDPPEVVAAVPRISLSDLPEVFEVIGHEEADGVISCPMTTGGIIYTDILFDISDFSYEELDYANILARLLTMCGADGDDYVSFQKQLRFVSGGSAFFLESGAAVDGGERVFLIARLKSLPQLHKEGLSLLSRLLLRPERDDKRVKAAVTDIITDFQSSIVSNAQSYAMSKAGSAFSPSLAIGERIAGIECWKRMEELSGEEGLSPLVGAVCRKAVTKARMKVHVTAEDDVMPEALGEARRFRDLFPEGSAMGEVRHEVPDVPLYSAGTLSSKVSFLGIAGRSVGLRDPLASPLRVFLSILSSTTLWKKVREKGGAYGVGIRADLLERVWTFYSYRDPRLDGTIDDFLSSVDEAVLDEKTLSDAVISNVSASYKPSAPANKSLTDLRRIVYGILDEDRLRNAKALRNVTLEDAERARAWFRENLKDYRTAAVCDRSEALSSSHPFVLESLPL